MPRMSSDVEHLYVQRNEPALSTLLPGHVEWEDEGGEFVADGGEWLLFVSGPEPVDPAEIPEELRAAVPDLRFEVYARIEPINPGHSAWEFLNAVFDAVGGGLGGASYDIHSGRVIAWEDGRRIHPAPASKKGFLGRFRR
jgi:hypothetical protein